MYYLCSNNAATGLKLSCSSDLVVDLLDRRESIMLLAGHVSQRSSSAFAAMMRFAHSDPDQSLLPVLDPRLLWNVPILIDPSRRLNLPLVSFAWTRDREAQSKKAHCLIACLPSENGPSKIFHLS